MKKSLKRKNSDDNNTQIPPVETFNPLMAQPVYSYSYVSPVFFYPLYFPIFPTNNNVALDLISTTSVPSPELIQSELQRLEKVMMGPQATFLERENRDKIIIDILNRVLDSKASDKEKLRFLLFKSIRKKFLLLTLCNMDYNLDKVMALFAKNNTDPEVIKRIDKAIQHLLERIHQKGMPEKLISCLTAKVNIDGNFRIKTKTTNLLEHWLTFGVEIDSGLYVEVLTEILAKTSTNTKIGSLEKWMSLYLQGVDITNYPQEVVLQEKKSENSKNSITHLVSNLIKTDFTGLFDALSNNKLLCPEVSYFHSRSREHPTKTGIQEHSMRIELGSQESEIVLIGYKFGQMPIININVATSLFIIAIHTKNSELIKILTESDLRDLIKWDTYVICSFQQNIEPKKARTFKAITLTLLLAYLEGPSFPYLSQYLDTLSRALFNGKYLNLPQFFGAVFPGSDNNQLLETERFLEVLRQRPTTVQMGVHHKLAGLMKEVHDVLFQSFLPLDLGKIIMAYLFFGTLDNSLSEHLLQQSASNSSPLPCHSSYSSVSFYSSATSSSSSQLKPNPLPDTLKLT